MDKLEVLKTDVQEIIDLFSKKKLLEANEKLVLASEKIDELIDITEDDTMIVEICHYQVLLNQLHQKINALN